MKKKAFYQEYKEEIDFYFIHSFAIEPFYFSEVRNKILVFPVYRYICNVLQRELPNYRDNIYAKSIYINECVKYYDLIKK